jgi:hypothetical protein
MTDILQSVRRFVKQRDGARDKENRAKKRKVNQIFIQAGQKSSKNKKSFKNNAT